MPTQAALDLSAQIERDYVLVRESGADLPPYDMVQVTMRHRETGKLYWGYRYTWGYGQLEPCRWSTEQ